MIDPHFPGVNMQDRILRPKQVAEYLGLSQQTLALWRRKGDMQLPWIKFGRSVRYKQSTVLKFIVDNTHSDPVKGGKIEDLKYI